MKTLILIPLLASCSSITTTTTTRTDGKRTVTVTEKKVDGGVVATLSQLFVGAGLTILKSNETP